MALLLLAARGFAADTNTVLDSWFAAQKTLKTWSADFVQTRSLKTLTKPLTGEGHVSFQVPNQFHWQLEKPAPTIAVRGGDDMYIIYPRLKRAEHYPLGANAPRDLRDVMALLDVGFPRSRADFESQFQVRSITETNGAWLLALQPRSSTARQMMPQLKIAFATNNFSLTSTEMSFADGSRMRNDFTNAVFNGPLDAGLFEWKPPADYKVTEPFSNK